MLNSKDVASVVLGGTDDEVLSLLSALQTDSGNARKVLSNLSKHSRPEVRGWVPAAAVRLLGAEAVPYLVALARDPNPAVSNVALQDLLDLDPDAARPLIPRIRRQVSLSDPHQAGFAMWTLARLGDLESAGAIRRAGERPDYPYLQKTAEVVALLLEGKTDEIIRRIREHDHDHMRWLADAAIFAGGQRGVEAVTECAETAPDAECRDYCRWRLQELSRTRR